MPPKTVATPDEVSRQLIEEGREVQIKPRHSESKNKGINREITKTTEDAPINYAWPKLETE